MANRTLPIGIAIIGVGIIIGLGKMGVIQAVLSWVWPLVVIAAGAAAYVLVSARKLPSAGLVPAASGVGIGLVLTLCSWFGWGWIKALWPAMPLAVAFGFFQFVVSERIHALRTAALSACIAFAGLLVITMLVHLNGFIAALLLIIAGVAVAARKPKWW